MHMIAFTTPAMSVLSTACGDVSRSNAALERARGDHRAVQSDPRAHRDAEADLKHTFEAMCQANAAWSSGASEQAVNHLAGLASLHAAIARATLDLRSAEAMVHAAAADRSRHQRALRMQAAQGAQQPAVVRHASSTGQGAQIRRIDTVSGPVRFSWLTAGAAPVASLGSVA